MCCPTVDLPQKAKWVWRETLAIHRRAPETRLASSLSAVEIFVALYYGEVLHLHPANPLLEDRDRCIVSKGHGSICLYPILADLGFFPKEELERVGMPGSFLGGIPDPIIPGYETVNGSLGHGAGVGAGMALGLKRKRSSRSVFVVVGDGELHEGAHWEAFMFASHHHLDNLNLIVDDNRIGMLGFTEETLSHGSLTDRLSAFGWDCREVNGHDIKAVQEALLQMKRQAEGKPKALLARTRKGNGVPELENAPLSHVISLSPERIDELLRQNV